jgi:DNA-binding NarL/FixJ family response regulator
LTVRILLADDHPLVRRGLRELIEREDDMEVVAEAENGACAVEKALAQQVDLAVMDVAMPRLTGLQAAEQLSRRRPSLRILILSMHDNEQYLFAALRAGAHGYVLKSQIDSEVIAACRAIMQRGGFVCPSSTPPYVLEYLERSGRGETARDDPLTARELEVLKLVAEEHSSEQIAATLVISVKTVERHRANIIDKLGLRDRVALTRYAIRRGLVQP